MRLRHKRFRLVRLHGRDRQRQDFRHGIPTGVEQLGGPIQIWIPLNVSGQVEARSAAISTRVAISKLSTALDHLEQIDERKVRALELRFFLGCTSEETAELLNVSRATVDRDLELAKAWLYRRLCQENPGANPGH